MNDSVTEPTDYDYDSLPTQSPEIQQSYMLKSRIMFVYVLAYSATLLMGISLNSTIIVIISFYRRIFNKDRPCQWVQVLALAITHLAFCLVTPLYLTSAWNHFSWTYGKSLCKLGSYIMYMNMFSNSLIITLWNVRWCVPKKCCSFSHVSSSMTLLAFFLGAILAAPSLLSRDTQKTAAGEICFDNFDYTERKSMSNEAINRRLSVVLSRLFLGLVLPLVVIGISSRRKMCCGRRRNTEENSGVLRPATFAHFLCWAPLLCLSMVQVALKKDSNFFTYALPIATGLAALSSVIYPLICLIQGKKDRDQDSEGTPTFDDVPLKGPLA